MKSSNVFLIIFTVTVISSIIGYHSMYANPNQNPKFTNPMNNVKQIIVTPELLELENRLSALEQKEVIYNDRVAIWGNELAKSNTLFTVVCTILIGTGIFYNIFRLKELSKEFEDKFNKLRKGNELQELINNTNFNRQMALTCYTANRQRDSLLWSVRHIDSDIKLFDYKKIDRSYIDNNIKYLERLMTQKKFKEEYLDKLNHEHIIELFIILDKLQQNNKFPFMDYQREILGKLRDVMVNLHSCH